MTVRLHHLSCKSARQGILLWSASVPCLTDLTFPLNCHSISWRLTMRGSLSEELQEEHAAGASSCCSSVIVNLPSVHNIHHTKRDQLFTWAQGQNISKSCQTGQTQIQRPRARMLQAMKTRARMIGHIGQAVVYTQCLMSSRTNVLWVSIASLARQMRVAAQSPKLDLKTHVNVTE